MPKDMGFTTDFDKVKQYINTNNKKPIKRDKNKEIQILGSWVSTQQKNYNKKLDIMKNQEIYNKWTEFKNNDKYKEYFLSNAEMWNNHFEEVKKYIDTNNKRPNKYDKNKEIQILGSWISTQKKNYTKKQDIMKDQEIYNKWTEFINNDKYKEYFI